MPEAKLKKRELDSAAQRVVTLKQLVGGEAPDVRQVEDAILSGLSSELGIEAERGEPSAEEEALAVKLFDEEIGRDEFVFEIDDPGGADVYSSERQGLPAERWPPMCGSKDARRSVSARFFSRATSS